MKNRYNVVKDLDGWGVTDETGTLINNEPMGRGEAQELALQCNRPETVEDLRLDDPDFWGYTSYDG